MLPDDQQLLFRDLCAKLDTVADEGGLAQTMGLILRSLLRRKGDAQFLATVQDMLTVAMAGQDFAAQKAVAVQVVQVVIEKRPEVAVAWQALNGPRDAAPALRRHADAVAAAAPPPAPEAPPPVAAALPVDYDFAPAERVVALYVAEVLERRLKLFAVGDPRFPSLAYRHERPFFLFDPAFAAVVHRFVEEVLVVQCREALQRKVYKHLSPRLLMDEKGLHDFLSAKRAEAWKILLERLTKWSGHYRSAEAKLAAAEAGEASGPEFAEVEVPVTHDRVFRVLGVEFTIGTKTSKRRMRVRVKATTEPTADELEALTLITRFRNLAADSGMELPDACDFLFLRTLLEFDAKKFGSAIKEFVGLARHKDTSRQYLFDRLNYIDETYANTLSDALVLMMFHDAEERFGFKEVYDVFIGTALHQEAQGKKRPFLRDEVCRRPRELAFQVREALRRRYDEATLAGSVKQLLDVVGVMGRTRFEAEIKAAQGVFAAFPLAFAGDPDEPVFSHVGHILHRAVGAETVDVAATLDAVHHVYAPVAERLRAAVRQG